MEENIENFFDRESEKRRSILKNERTENITEYTKRKKEKMDR